jgi:hypothetical protein
MRRWMPALLGACLELVALSGCGSRDGAGAGNSTRSSGRDDTTPSTGSTAGDERDRGDTDARAEVSPSSSDSEPSIDGGVQNEASDGQGGAAGTETNRSAGASAIPCQSSNDCRLPGRRGRCFTQGYSAQYTQSFQSCPEAGAWREQHEPGTCVFDECTDDSSCESGTRCATLDMMPYPQRVCVPSECSRSSDCRLHGGGTCRAYVSSGRCRPGGWACNYPSDPCSPGNPRKRCPYQRGFIGFCVPREGHFTCVQEPAVPQ